MIIITCRWVIFLKIDKNSSMKLRWKCSAFLIDITFNSEANNNESLQTAGYYAT